MKEYILKRLAMLIFVLLGVSIITRINFFFFSF